MPIIIALIFGAIAVISAVWAIMVRRTVRREAELMQVTCPIGLPGLRGKEPEVIAASVAAQLLLVRQELASR